MAQRQAEMRRFNTVRWTIYILVALVVVLPYVLRLPLPLKFTPSRDVRKLYDRMDSLKPGSHVLLSLDYDAASQAELQPMSRALLEHCFKKGLIPIVMTHWQSGLGLDKQVIDEVANKAKEALGKEVKSGRDYVFLGFKPGYSNLVLNMGENLKGAFDKDYFGQSTGDMPALQGVSSLKDIDMGVDLAAGSDVGMWIAYGSDRFNFPLGAGTTAVQAPDMTPFLDSKQLVGLLGGLRGAADYETLLDMPDGGTTGMLAQSSTHVLVILLIVAANARLLLGRSARKRE